MKGSSPGVSRAVLTENGKIKGALELARTPRSLLTNPALLAGAAGLMAQLARVPRRSPRVAGRRGGRADGRHPGCSHRTATTRASTGRGHLMRARIRPRRPVRQHAQPAITGIPAQPLVHRLPHHPIPPGHHRHRNTLVQHRPGTAAPPHPTPPAHPAPSTTTTSDRSEAKRTLKSRETTAEWCRRSRFSPGRRSRNSSGGLPTAAHQLRPQLALLELLALNTIRPEATALAAVNGSPGAGPIHSLTRTGRMTKPRQD